MLAYLGIKSCLNGGAKTASKLTHFALGRKSEHAVVGTALMQGLVISWLLKKCLKNEITFRLKEFKLETSKENKNENFQTPANMTYNMQT